MRSKVWALVGVGVVGLAAGCSQETGGGSKPVENTALLCNNGQDDDGDAHIDCLDQDCWGTLACADVSGGKDSGPDTASGDTSQTDTTASDTTTGDTTTGDTTTGDTTTADTVQATDTASSTDVASSTDAGPDIAAQDSLQDSGGDAGADTAILDVSVPDVPDSTAETTAGPDVAITPDLSAADVPDTGAPACKDGQLQRCWVECPQSYASGCISGKIPILILGTQLCGGGQWGACNVKASCGDLVGECSNGQKKATEFLCLDGSTKAGGYLCSKPLGASCEKSYHINWPITDCPDLCSDTGSTCDTPGAEQACQVHCSTPDGPLVAGKRKCNDYCNGKFWGPCLTDDGCLNVK